MRLLKISTLLRIMCIAVPPLYISLISPEAQAGCVSSDVNAQYAIASPTNSSSTQANNLNVQFGENCLGNSSHGNNLQIHSGVKPTEQERSRQVELSSPKNEDLPFVTPNIETNINQQLSLPVLP